MAHHPRDHHKVHNKHQNQRNQCRLDKRIRIPYRLVSRKAVAVIIHRNHNIFEHRISENVSNQCRDERHNDRHRQIMCHQFPARVTRSAKCSDGSRLPSNRVADCNGKNKSNNQLIDYCRFTIFFFKHFFNIIFRLDYQLSNLF